MALTYLAWFWQKWKFLGTCIWPAVSWLSPHFRHPDMQPFGWFGWYIPEKPQGRKEWVRSYSPPMVLHGHVGTGCPNCSWVHGWYTTCSIPIMLLGAIWKFYLHAIMQGFMCFTVLHVGFHCYPLFFALNLTTQGHYCPNWPTVVWRRVRVTTLSHI